MILCLGPTPAVQRAMVFRRLAVDGVNRAAATIDGAGGKSVNVAKVLHALGESPLAMGFLGGERGAWLRSHLAQRGIAMKFVPVPAETRQCVTALDESSGTSTELVEESRPVEATEYERLLSLFRERVGSCRATVMSGSLTPGGPADFYLRCTRAARKAGVLAVVDAQGPALAEALKGNPDLVKPNRDELSVTMGRELPDEAAVQQAMRDLWELGARRVVVTGGKDPTLAFDGQRFWRVVPPRIAARNPIGSGDAVAAGLVWQLLRGADLGEACRWGTAAGSANALTRMAAEVTRADVERLACEVRVEALQPLQRAGSARPASRFRKSA